MENRKFVKLSDLVNERFTIVKVGKFTYKKWDNENRKMLVSDNWVQGYNKVYQVETDKGLVDMSSSKVGEMLESVSKFGESSIVGRVFNVKSNGKTGMDIRYFINPERTDTSGSGYQKAMETAQAIKERVAKEEDEDDQFAPIDMSDIPF
jgi:hypothetical protein